MDTYPHATIHYTWDGSRLTSKSRVYDPSQVLFIGGIYDGDHGLKAGYTIRAVAMDEGHTNSGIANFQYVVDRRDYTAYGAVLKPAFSPNVKTYTANLAKNTSTTTVSVEPTSSRSSALTINGHPAKAEQANAVSLKGKSTPITVHVASPTAHRQQITL